MKTVATTHIAKFKSEFACKLIVSLGKLAFASILLRKHRFYTAQSFHFCVPTGVMWEINSPLSTLNNNYSSDGRGVSVNYPHPYASCPSVWNPSISRHDKLSHQIPGKLSLTRTCGTDFRKPSEEGVGETDVFDVLEVFSRTQSIPSWKA